MGKSDRWVLKGVRQMLDVRLVKEINRVMPRALIERYLFYKRVCQRHRIIFYELVKTQQGLTPILEANDYLLKLDI